MIILTERIPEKGTVGFNLVFTDENGDTVTPDSIEWKLTDTDLNVIKNWQVVTPDSEIDIVLSGTDLDISDDLVGNDRILTVYYTYTSDLGAGLPMYYEWRFNIEKTHNEKTI